VELDLRERIGLHLTGKRLYVNRHFLFEGHIWRVVRIDVGDVMADVYLQEMGTSRTLATFVRVPVQQVTQRD